MKLHILGSGVCASHYNNDPVRYPPGYILETGDEKILIECSEGIRFRIEDAGFDYSDFQHLVISHAHPDHCALAHYLLATFVKSFWGGKKYKNKFLNIYCPNQITEEFQTIWNFYNPERKGEKGYDWPELIFHSLSNNTKPIMIGKTKLTAKNVYHGFGKVDALAFRFDDQKSIFVYSGDTGECDNIRKISKDADLFLCESSASIGDFETVTGYGHLNPFTAGDISKGANVKHLALTHYTGLNNDADMIKECKRSGFIEKVTITKDSNILEF